MPFLGDNIPIIEVPGQPNTVRAVVAELTGGLSTRTYPHILPSNYLSVATNVIFRQDGIISKRPGNIYYGSGTGQTGSGVPIESLFRRAIHLLPHLF
jgi:hypothetical protein